MKTLTLKSAFLLLTAFCCSAIAQPSDEAIEKLLDASGISKQAAQYPQAVQAGFMQGVQQGAPIPKKTVDLILGSAQQKISPEVVLGKVKERIKSSLTQAEINQLMDWYQSDTGRKIAQAEEKASTMQGYQEMMSQAQTLLGHTKRVETAKRIDDLVGATQFTMAVQEQSGVAVYSAIMFVVAPNQPLDLAPYEAQMQAMAPQMKQSIEQMVTVSFVYSYQDIADSELASYEKFLAKPVTAKFNKLAMQGVNQGFQIVLADWAADIGKIIVEEQAATAG
ncbi:DUF2059 domain-containing protein [Catenovulum sediminis]|uniref:DUF2059 domain-containing protein n=1 Tax=Catenovulum sediminis TaxID=1740262 RepID=UPI00163D907F|nr:DUF2059 domain-containing protein [Catenovulum sediminis]